MTASGCSRSRAGARRATVEAVPRSCTGSGSATSSGGSRSTSARPTRSRSRASRARSRACATSCLRWCAATHPTRPAMHSVLVVDDEPFVRLSLVSLHPFGAEGFDFAAEAGNGAEALAVLAAHPEIDIVLLDLSMPVIDGLEVLRRLRAEPLPRPIAVIVLSAHDDYHLVRDAFKLGAAD